VSRLLDRRIRSAGLDRPRDVSELLRADLLALGAVADRARRARHGDRTRIGRARAEAEEVVVRAGQDPADRIRVLGGRSIDTVLVRPDRDAPATGEEVLRTAAVCRLALDAAHVAIAWDDVGIELAQVALSFGVDELLGAVTTGASLVRGIPRAELEDLIRKAGREAECLL
jgi:hypothetical protein